uniref:erythromycin esterase family protein n=1 Tax=Longirhabdus pacifica TaxID=2305227 RepID=UPI0013E8E315
KEQKNTSNPIQIAGFDMQPHTNNLLYDYFLKFDATFAQNVQELELDYYNFISVIKAGDFPEDGEEKQQALIVKYENVLNEWNELHSSLKKDVNEDVTKLVERIFSLRIRSLTENFIRVNYPNGVGFTNFADNARDKVMSDNLVWLLEEMYPDEKLIVWAHNAHIMKNYSMVKNEDNYVLVNMTEQLPAEIKEQAYGIGLYMHSGNSAFNDRNVMPVYSNHKANSVENLLNEPNYPVSFLNIDRVDDENNTYWWNSEAIGKTVGSSHQYEEKYIPSEQYDGLILIEDVNFPNYVR